MDSLVNITSVAEQGAKFWPFFLCSCFPNGYFEEENIELSRYIQEHYKLDMVWVHEFTKYYDGVFDENDGYVENPRTLMVELNSNNKLSIEFHPGDTIFHLNDIEIGSTGPHYRLHSISWNELMRYVDGVMPEITLLLLPMVYLRDFEYCIAKQTIKSILLSLPFNKENNDVILECILADITLD